MTQPPAKLSSTITFSPADTANLSGYWDIKAQSNSIIASEDGRGDYATVSGAAELKPLIPAGDPPPSLPPTPPSDATLPEIPADSIKLGSQYKKAGTMTFSEQDTKALSGFWGAPLT